MPKNSIHPEYYSNAKVYCDGQLVMKVGSTNPVLKVDIWSGTHPFYTGSQRKTFVLLREALLLLRKTLLLQRKTLILLRKTLLLLKKT